MRGAAKNGPRCQTVETGPTDHSRSPVYVDISQTRSRAVGREAREHFTPLQSVHLLGREPRRCGGVGPVAGLFYFRSRVVEGGGGSSL